MSSPKITVVVPVYNRTKQLVNALKSIQNQTFDDFECIVVDDASAVPIKPLVNSLDDSRFIYKRNNENGGPNNARVVAYKAMRGEYLFSLDSDWEAFPWALSQAAMYLDSNPTVDAVSGLHLRNHDSKLFVRVQGNKRVVTPEDYLKLEPVPDCVGAVRKIVVEEWLLKRTDYYALESHLWFTFGLKHNQLYVDEPWAKYNVLGSDRVTGKINERRLNDFVKFAQEHKGYIEKIDCPYLTNVLLRGWRSLEAAGWKDHAQVFEGYLKLRNITLTKSSAPSLRSRISMYMDKYRFTRHLRDIVKNKLQQKERIYYL